MIYRKHIIHYTVCVRERKREYIHVRIYECQLVLECSNLASQTSFAWSSLALPLGLSLPAKSAQSSYT